MKKLLISLTLAGLTISATEPKKITFWEKTKKYYNKNKDIIIPLAIIGTGIVTYFCYKKLNRSSNFTDNNITIIPTRKNKIGHITQSSQNGTNSVHIVNGNGVISGNVIQINDNGNNIAGTKVVQINQQSGKNNISVSGNGNVVGNIVQVNGNKGNHTSTVISGNKGTVISCSNGNNIINGEIIINGTRMTNNGELIPTRNNNIIKTSIDGKINYITSNVPYTLLVSNKSEENIIKTSINKNVSDYLSIILKNKQLIAKITDTNIDTNESILFQMHKNNIDTSNIRLENGSIVIT